MGERLIKPYEISVWEDKLIQNGAEYEFKEIKLAVIGSDTMTGLNKVYDPVFNKKSNGEKTLTFSLKYKYFDPYSGNDGIINPFAALLVNERKVKLHYDNQWYEFIIKEHSESSDELTWTYTCTDAFVVELSKQGYNITFDSELNNNQGTAAELAKETLKDTDWQIGKVDDLKQLIEEPIYQAVLHPASGINIINVSGTDEAPPATQTDIYLFYSFVKNQNGKYIQFIIRDNNRPYVIDDKKVITDTNFRITTDLVYKNNQFETENGVPIITIENIETQFHANRLAYGQLTVYDPVMQRTVNRYKVYEKNIPGDQEVYSYTDYIYTTSNVVMNYITNGDNFNVLEDGSLQGWNPYTDQSLDGQGKPKTVNKLELVTKPELGTGKTLADITGLSQIEGFLKVKFNGPRAESSEGYYYNTVYNSGIENNSSTIQSIAKGDKFVFRWRAGISEDEENKGANQLRPFSDIRIMVANYTRDETNRFGNYYRHINKDDVIIDFTLDTGNEIPQLQNNYITGGAIEDAIEADTGEPTGKKTYVIDGVSQTPSTKYIYIDKNSNINNKYVWSVKTNDFVSFNEDDPKSYEQYLPYYYLIGTAKKGVTSASLSDPTYKIGIFLYTNNATDPIYIQDIQLTRYIPDEKEKPLLIGNIPTAVSIPTTYYYLQPQTNDEADDIVTYTDVNELIDELFPDSETTIKPLYNENSEKNLSISISQSNCFNILQTIAETFECWIDLVVDHDDRGYIRLDNGKPHKYVYLREYVGKDNYAGFKYGINLQSIERTVNSEEIVTKLIVDQSQSDLVDEGYVSIANAPSNQSGESYILNFDYYYGQGLLNREETEEDKINFISETAALNKLLQEKNKERNDLEMALTVVSSNRDVYTTLVETAQDTQMEALSDFKELTGFSYEEYKEYHEGLLDGLDKIDEFDEIDHESNRYVFTIENIPVNGSNIKVTCDTVYNFIGGTASSVPENVEEESEGEVQLPEITYNGKKTFIINRPIASDTVRITYLADIEQLTEEETILDVLGKIYASSSTINNYSGLLSNIEQEYWNLHNKLRGSENYKVKIWTGKDVDLQRHVYVELNEFLPGFKFSIGEELSGETSVTKRLFDFTTNATEFTINQFPEGYSAEKTIYSISDGKITSFYLTSDITIIGIEDEIKDIQEAKDQLAKDFNNKYSRFIQEGTWNSTDYIDSEQYYLDALQVSSTSAQPIVSYTINVVEISELEGFEWYKFDAGDKSYVEDTEFFGWANVKGVLTPAREEVIISEVEWHLDQSEENVITVQNYKTRFEDLFQRISAAVQTVQYNEATYAKISTLLDANGTINQDVLLKSLNNISGKKYTLTTDGSIAINGNQILIRNLTNPTNRVIINNEGIAVSADGGNTWKKVIDGFGINADAVITGSLNTQQVIIGSSDNPSFRWDKAGISAYKSGQDGLYDLHTYVRYDQNGLYGIKNGDSYKPYSLEEIKNRAHFAVTWDGFFIRNDYTGGGRVEITSDNDFRVLNTVNNEEKEKIKIGALEWMVPANASEFSLDTTYYILGENGYEVVEEPTISNINSYYEKKFTPQPGIEPSLYGIRIRNNAGEDVMKTDDDGNLILTGAIEALEGNFGKLITVGKNGDDVPYIAIDGRTAEIYSSNYSDGAGTGWIINKYGDAVFNNITARGAIKTAVFEYAEIQAVGGIFLFRPSSTIRKATIASNNTDLILEVEKPQLFVKITYNKIENPDSQANPQDQGWYIRNEYGYMLSTDIQVDNNKEYFEPSNTYGSWCKISNYISNGREPDITQSVLVNNGLTHVYPIINVNLSNKTVTLSGAAAMVIGNSPITTLEELKGGALIDMGRSDGTSNYGIGVNSSDNTVNLPARAISLFETSINSQAGNQLKVTYSYRGILGTLPTLTYEETNSQVNQLYHDYMEGTQGIYTDNMYIGNNNQYIAFYTDNSKNKHLKINAKELTLKAGSFQQYGADSEQNFIYLSNEDYGNKINIDTTNTQAWDKVDWRLLIGNKFGVDKAGNLYASNAIISGHIQATSGSFGTGRYSAQIEDGKLIIQQDAVNGLESALNEAKGYVLTVETDYSNGQNINLIAHLYYGNTEVTTSKPGSMFHWYRKSETEDYFKVENPVGNPQENNWYELINNEYILTTDTEVVEEKIYYEYTCIGFIDANYSISFDREKAGYGTTIICRFNDEALLTTPDNYAVETPDNYLLTARV